MVDFYGGQYGGQYGRVLKNGTRKLIDPYVFKKRLMSHGFSEEAALAIISSEAVDTNLHNYKGVIKARGDNIKRLGYTQKGTPRKTRRGNADALAAYREWRVIFANGFADKNGRRPTREELKQAWQKYKGGKSTKKTNTRRKRQTKGQGEGMTRRRTTRTRRPRGGVIAGAGYYS